MDTEFSWWQQKEIIISFIGMVSAIVVALITGIFSKYKTIKKSFAQAEKEVKFQKVALDFGDFIHDWAATHDEIKSILENTEIDRFIMFRAWNGELTPKWTTNVFQMRLGDQEPIQYVHFPLDNDYNIRLMQIVKNGSLYFIVKDIPDSAIKSVYEAEGVKCSVWCHILSEKVEGGNSSAHTYCSFSSHTSDFLEESTITKCKILAGRLKGVANSYNN